MNDQFGQHLDTAASEASEEESLEKISASLENILSQTADRGSNVLQQYYCYPKPGRTAEQQSLKRESIAFESTEQFNELNSSSHRLIDAPLCNTLINAQELPAIVRLSGR